jgi:nitrogen fixation/metabolism regulation signal transduction histidine kinase
MTEETPQTTNRVPLKERLHPESWLLWTIIAALLPLAGMTLLLIWTGPYSLALRWTLTALLVAASGWFFLFVHDRIVFILRSIANLLISLREEDYSVRLNLPRQGDALGQVVKSVNALRDTLHNERTGAAETGALLQKVMAQIDVALFSFDPHQRLQLVNKRGLALVGKNRPEVLGRTAAELGLADCLSGADRQVIDLSGHWQMQRTTYREQGKARDLLILSDLTGPLRQRELEAWQRLVRVLRHEISNSLAPIQSYAQTLQWLMAQSPRPTDWESDFTEGLTVIQGRAAALNHMMAAYKNLSGLPAPECKPLNIGRWVQQAVRLAAHESITVEAGPPVEIAADKVLLDQLLLNLLKNAVEAVAQTTGGISIGWRLEADAKEVEIWIADEGPGLSNTENLFVPFFTTKKDGTGIGLALSRQIAEAHKGRLTLENRTIGNGCLAILRLPID